MKKSVVLSLICLILVATSYASFPVKTSNESSNAITSESYNTDHTIKFSDAEVNNVTQSLKKDAKLPTDDDDEMIILLALWFFLGFLAAHRWYAKRPAGWNILFILTAGGCGIWAIVDLVKILQGKF